MRYRFFAIGMAAMLGAGAAAWAADVPGSKDPPDFKRYQGSEIISYTTRSYDPYVVALGAIAGGKFQKSTTVEGAITRLIYRVPTGHTSLELLRNYEQMLADAGFTQIFELANSGLSAYDSDWFYANYYWQNLPVTQNNDANPFTRSTLANYVAAKASKGGQDFTVAILVAESSGLKWPKPGVKDPVAINPGEVLVGVDLVTAKAVEQKMVVVSAADMADSLATKGSVDIYGILFDVDKTDIKPDSKPTLDEVGNLLKIDRSLKLEISGHTDNTGSADHNMKLSQDRAQAVVDALVKNYGVDASRLQAKGYGDTKPVAPNDTDANKARNRRVELSKL